MSLGQACVNAFSKIAPELTALMERWQKSTRSLCSLWNKQCTQDVFNGEVSGCRQQQRGRDAHACMNLLCFYTLLVLSSSSTGDIIYNPRPPLKQWKEEGSILWGIH